MKVLSIDPSSAHIGLVVVDIDPKTFIPIIVDSFCLELNDRFDYPDNVEPIIHKAYIVRQVFKRLLEENDLDYVIYEKPFINKLFLNSYGPLNAITTTMLVTVHEYDSNIGIKSFSPKEIKKGVGNAKADKNEMKELVSKLSWIDFDLKTISEHEIDAIALIHLFIKTYSAKKYNLL